MAKNVGVRLQLEDEFSKKLKEAKKNIAETTKQIREQTEQINDLKKKYQSLDGIDKKDIETIKRIKQENRQLNEQISLLKDKKKELNANLDVEKLEEKTLRSAHSAQMKRDKDRIASLKSIARYAKAAAVAAAGAAITGGIKTGITAASEMEMLRANIETVTKSPARASDVMKHAVHLANRSAFDNAEMVEAASMLETYGLNTEKFLTTIGDTAAIFNRDVVDIARGFGKAAVGGQFDVFGDIGITRDKIDAYGKSLGIDLFDATRVRDYNKLAEVLKMYMDENYAGGMEKQADTLTGMWSTIKGIGRSALGIITGVRANGKIVDGSLFDTLKEKLDGIRDTMTEWESNGTFESIAEKMKPIVSGFESIAYSLSKIKENAELEFITNNIGTGTEILGGALKIIGKAAEWHIWLASLIPNIMAGKKDTIAENFKSIWNLDAYKTPAYASGTSYHPGGTALVGERGPELVNLPRGSSVQNASATRSILRGGNTVNIYIDGARRSDDDLANTVARKLLEALDNV